MLINTEHESRAQSADYRSFAHHVIDLRADVWHLVRQQSAMSKLWSVIRKLRVQDTGRRENHRITRSLFELPGAH